MKKLLVISVISIMMLSSCEDDTVLPASDQGLNISQTKQAVVNADGAVPFKEVIIEEFENFEFYNPCTDEIMTITGRARIQIHGVVNGNKSTLIAHAHSQGGTAVGEDGRKYILTGGSNFQETTFSDGMFTTKYEYADLALTAGGGNNFIIREIFHIKVDAQGNVTYEREPLMLSYCR
jgi:hypothetical protein